MNIKKILLISLIAIAIIASVSVVSAAQLGDCSDEGIASTDVDVVASSGDDVYTSSGTTHTYKATGSTVYVKYYNWNYKLSSKAKKQINSIKNAPKKTYKLTIDDDTYKSLINAKKTGRSDGYTFDTNYKCKVLKPVFKTKTIKKTIINKKYTNRQKYYNDYSKYFIKYNSDKYNMNVKFHYYKGTHNIKYVTIKVTKKVKQTTISKFKTGYTKIKADICYQATNGELSKGSHLLFYGNILGYDFTNFVATKQNFKF